MRCTPIFLSASVVIGSISFARLSIYLLPPQNNRDKLSKSGNIGLHHIDGNLLILLIRMEKENDNLLIDIEKSQNSPDTLSLIFRMNLIVEQSSQLIRIWEISHLIDASNDAINQNVDSIHSSDVSAIADTKKCEKPKHYFLPPPLSGIVITVPKGGF